MDPLDIIYQYYRPESALAKKLIAHSRAVRDKALTIARRFANAKPDLKLIAEAAMLHDIGIIKTFAGRIGCNGNLPYICHGVEGRKMLEHHGLPRHAMVCERHVGVGITIRDIQKQRLALPVRDMVPVTLEEKIICYADKFFSKTNGTREKSTDAVIAQLMPYGLDKVQRFKQWRRGFEQGEIV
ncbi:MAG: HDIG domain-containing protein [Desulfobacteraceae bacterium]|jgi:uncharacterized protein